MPERVAYLETRVLPRRYSPIDGECVIGWTGQHWERIDRPGKPMRPGRGPLQGVLYERDPLPELPPHTYDSLARRSTPCQPQ